MIYSIVLLIMIVGTVTAFLPYSFLINNTPLLSLTQEAFAQGDSALEDSSGGAVSGNGAEPTGGGSTEGPTDDTEPTDGTEPTGGGSTEGPVDEAITGENGNVTQFDEYTCYSDSKPPSCQCIGVGDCVKMVLSGQCKDVTWKETGGGDSGECEWKV